MNPNPSLVRWLPLALIITFLAGVVYVTVQQVYRQGGNDPQIQLSEDAAAQLEAGTAPGTLAGGPAVDMAKSLAPYLIIYNDKGELLDADAQLNGKVPSLPTGVLDYVRSHHQERVTWQPASGVRVAAVVTRFSGKQSTGFVLAGRSLREVEKRESGLGTMVGALWLFSLIATYFVTTVGERVIRG